MYCETWSPDLITTIGMHLVAGGRDGAGRGATIKLTWAATNSSGVDARLLGCSSCEHSGVDSIRAPPLPPSLAASIRRIALSREGRSRGPTVAGCRAHRFARRAGSAQRQALRQRVRRSRRRTGWRVGSLDHPPAVGCVTHGAARDAERTGNQVVDPLARQTKKIRVATEIAVMAQITSTSPSSRDRLRDVDDVMPYVQVGHRTPHSSAGWPAGADLHRVRHSQWSKLRPPICAHKAQRRSALRLINAHCESRDIALHHSAGEAPRPVPAT